MPFEEGGLERLQGRFEGLDFTRRRPAAVIHQRHDADAPVPIFVVLNVLPPFRNQPISMPSNLMR